MYVVAVIGDLLGLIPFVNVVTGFMTLCILGVMGLESGVNIFSGKNIFGTLVMLVVEEVPGLSVLPGFTIRVWLAKRAARQNA
jgi:hypothetical protein